MTCKEHNLKLGLIWLIVPLIVGLGFNLSSYFGFIIWIGFGLIFIGKGLIDGWSTKDKDSSMKE